MTMQKVPSFDAQNEFQFVMDQVCSGLGPVLITGMKGNAVLVREEDWRTLHRKLEALDLLTDSRDALDQFEQMVAARAGGSVSRD